MKHGLYHHSPAEGFSLIELLVGLTLGLVIIALGVSSYVATQKTAATVRDRTQLQQKADQIIAQMVKLTQQAGAITITPDSQTSGIAKPGTLYPGIDPNRTDGTAGLYIYGQDGAASPYDTLTIGYQDQLSSTDNTFDCMGNTANGSDIGTRIDNTYFVNANKVLLCTGANSAAGSDHLSENVEEFQIRYAVKKGSLTSRTTRWMNAADVSSLSAWPQVQAVEICLHLSGDLKNEITTPITFKDCRGQPLAPDDKIHLVMHRTVVLRNAVREGD